MQPAERAHARYDDSACLHELTKLPALAAPSPGPALLTARCLMMQDCDAGTTKLLQGFPGLDLKVIDWEQHAYCSLASAPDVQTLALRMCGHATHITEAAYPTHYPVFVDKSLAFANQPAQLEGLATYGTCVSGPYLTRQALRVALLIADSQGDCARWFAVDRHLRTMRGYFYRPPSSNCPTPTP